VLVNDAEPIALLPSSICCRLQLAAALQHDRVQQPCVIDAHVDIAAESCHQPVRYLPVQQPASAVNAQQSLIWTLGICSGLYSQAPELLLGASATEAHFRTSLPGWGASQGCSRAVYQLTRHNM
jgi:hypothetical protein